MIQKLHTEDAGTDGWRDLYIAALFEADRHKLASRLGGAERALMSRARELFASSGGQGEEWDAVQKGLYALRSLRYCLKGNSSEPAA